MTTTVKDWTEDAAIEIRDKIVDASMGTYEDLPSMDQIRSVIIDHCPFKPGVDYQEVKEPTLLMCVECHNTDSPTSAMARTWNHGRCAFCGGYFKVFRA